VHVDADHVAARRQPDLPLACGQDILRLVLLPAEQGVLAVGAEPSVSPWFASRAGRPSSRQARQYSGPPPGWKCQRQRALIRFCRVQEHLAKR
jgi:hypothetical protein